MKHLLYNQVNRINLPSIQHFIISALDSAPDSFWVVPSSSSGKYHPPEDQGEGGLIRHLIKATEIAYELANFYNINEENRDIVVSAAIIHDITKNGIPCGSGTDYRHGLIAYEWLDQFELKKPHKDEIRSCVRFHMGRWCEPKSEIRRATHPTTNELIVQLADYISSRKGVSFLPGISLSDSVIRDYHIS